MDFMVFIYGLLIGSFLNVVIYRLPKDENIAFPPSSCPSCQARIAWYDNIPLLSYILLRGRCRSCGNRISIQYPLVELANGLLYIRFIRHFGFNIDFIFYALMGSVLLAICLIDLKEMIIPDSLVLTILGLSIIHKAINFFVYDINPNILTSLGGLLIAGGFFLLIVLLTGGMGGGDVTLIGALGFVLGLRLILLNILLSFVLGSIISLILLATKLKTKKDPIPFGPFIIVAFYVVLLYGDRLFYWYFNLFL
jgi:leader peptidase (prepilin peptidase)/N-methyltransferase